MPGLLSLLPRLPCPFVLACPFRFDPDVTIDRGHGSVSMSGSGRRRFSLRCPWRDGCPIQASADGGLLRFDNDAIEVVA